MKTSVELFTGAGGLALGVSQAGFRHLAVVENDPTACLTIRENQRSGVKPVVDWPLWEQDVALTDFGAFGEIDLLAGGPPCQPFAISGKRLAHGDSRNMFPEMMRAVRELSPKAILIENVTGLLRGKLGRYFGYVLLQLRFPTLKQRDGESWPSHLARLRQHVETAGTSDADYAVHPHVVQAADFGVPQRRERVFIVAFRSDLKICWKCPQPTHSLDALLWEQWVSGDYWIRHAVNKRRRPNVHPQHVGRVARLRTASRPTLAAWRTVRDALAGLPEPSRNGHLPFIPNHVFVPGARTYAKHTGSPLDLPAKTLKAGAHGVPGGENIVVSLDGAIRYFSIRECARLQGFPDDYRFQGTWKTLVRQVGNAVPVAVVGRFAEAVHAHLVEAELQSRPLVREA